jgi:ABC-type phosphate transport system substrate-binding protein
VKTSSKITRTAIGGAFLALSLAAPAVAGTKPSSGHVQTSPSTPPRGADGVVDHIRAAGSDTTYDASVFLNRLYNGSVGCVLNAAGTACVAPVSGSYITTENYDHNTVVDEFPTGSGNGRNKMLGNLNLDGLPGNDIDPAVRINRSSSDPTAAGTFGSAFAKDGTSIVGFFGNTHNPTSRILSKENLQAIFVGSGPQAQPNDPNTGTCATNWSQLINPTTNTPFPAQPIVPFGIQTGSGTYQQFNSYLGGDPNTCPNRTHGGGAGYFENNSAPIDGGTDFSGATYVVNPNRANAIWWMSYGTLVTNPIAAGTAQSYIIRLPGTANGTPADIGGVDNAPSSTTIAGIKGQLGSYDLQRRMWKVFKKNDIDPTHPDSAGGEGGAANSYRFWLCRRTGHSLVPQNYNLEITKAIELAGFVRISNAESNANPYGGPAERCFNVLNP